MSQAGRPVGQKEIFFLLHTFPTSFYPSLVLPQTYSLCDSSPLIIKIKAERKEGVGGGEEVTGQRGAMAEIQEKNLRGRKDEIIIFPEITIPLILTLLC